MKVMKKWWIFGLALFLSAGHSFADVSNQAIIGLEADSSKEVTGSAGGLSVDLTDSYKTANSQLTVEYTRFYTPLKDDETNIELRRFIQHPSSASIGLTAVSQTVEDNTNPGSPWEGKGNVAALMVGGEYYFPTDTGLLLSLGGGNGTFEQTVNGTKQPDSDLNIMMYQFGVSQYIGSSVRMHLTTSGESFKIESGGTETQSKQNLMHLGGTGVIASMVELSGEIGGGKRTDQRTGVADDEYDVGQVKLGLAIYPGKSFSIGLSLEADADKQTGMPAGSEYAETSSEARLFATYWFSEKFGLHLPVYSVVKEKKSISGGFETKMTETNSGMGLYAGFRF